MSWTPPAWANDTDPWYCHACEEVEVLAGAPTDAEGNPLCQGCYPDYGGYSEADYMNDLYDRCPAMPGWGHGR
jgi:hypothetical protein